MRYIDRFCQEEEKAFYIIKKAAVTGALVVYTLVDPHLIHSVETACQLYGVPCVDLWTPLLDVLEVHLSAPRRTVPFTEENRQLALSTDYFKMIEAVEYTRKMDDGANPNKWHQADLIIVGVSRSGKTPLCIYLGQRGYKVANLPLVPGVPIPRQLFEVDQSKIVGLIIEPQLLMSIRKNRLGQMGVDSTLDYAEYQKVLAELEFAKDLYRQNPQWPVLDVTFRGVEETAARILCVMSENLGTIAPSWVHAFAE